MSWVKARLVKRASDDGFVEVEDDVELGREYEVDPATQRVVQLRHIPSGTIHTKEVVDARGGGLHFVELLDLPSSAEAWADWWRGYQ